MVNLNFYARYLCNYVLIDIYDCFTTCGVDDPEEIENYNIYRSLLVNANKYEQKIFHVDFACLLNCAEYLEHYIANDLDISNFMEMVSSKHVCLNCLLPFPDCFDYDSFFAELESEV